MGWELMLGSAHRPYSMSGTLLLVGAAGYGRHQLLLYWTLSAPEAVLALPSQKYETL